MHPQVGELKRVALDLFYPRWCVGCGQEGSLICDSCCLSLSRLEPPLCPQCGRPQPQGITCSSCLSEPAVIDGIRAPFRFEGVIREAIHQLKYQNLRALAQPLAQLLSDCLKVNQIPGELLTAVPLYKKRLRERGYNQSALLACELGKLTGLPVVEDCLIRKRPASPQVRTQTVAERRSNVNDAFFCPDNRVSDKTVIIIDDVATSGATLNACAAALKTAGASSVWGLTLAREV